MADNVILIDLADYQVSEEEYEELQPAFLWFVRNLKGMMVVSSAKPEFAELNSRLGGIALLMAFDFMKEKVQEVLAEYELKASKYEEDKPTYRN